MTYLVIWNGRHYNQEKIHAKSWLDFIEELNRLTLKLYNEPPDMIYLIDSRP